MIDKNRAKKVLLITFIIGFCILTAGFFGRVVMGKITEKVMSATFVETMDKDAPELGDIINRGLGRIAIRLTVSLIKNDPSGFVNAINDVSKSIGSIADTSGIGSFLLTPFFEEAARTAFQEGRRQLVESAGAYMPLLQFAAYYSELLVIGGIVSVVSLLLWFLVGGKTKDFAGVKAPFVIGLIWIVIILIMTIMMLNAANDTHNVESIESNQSSHYDFEMNNEASNQQTTKETERITITTSEETAVAVNDITVYWVNSANNKVYHTHVDCQELNMESELIGGTVEQAKTAGHISLCYYCAERDGFR